MVAMLLGFEKGERSDLSTQSLGRHHEIGLVTKGHQNTGFLLQGRGRALGNEMVFVAIGRLLSQCFH